MRSNVHEQRTTRPRDLIDRAIAGLEHLRDEIDAAVAATNLDADLKASLKSLQAQHDKALAEREAKQRSFDLEVKKARLQGAA